MSYLPHCHLTTLPRRGIAGPNDSNPCHQTAAIKLFSRSRVERHLVTTIPAALRKLTRPVGPAMSSSLTMMVCGAGGNLSVAIQDANCARAKTSDAHTFSMDHGVAPSVTASPVGQPMNVCRFRSFKVSQAFARAIFGGHERSTRGTSRPGSIGGEAVRVGSRACYGTKKERQGIIKFGTLSFSRVGPQPIFPMTPFGL